MSNKPKEPRRITNVYRFANDMVMVFDQHGRQMSEYQGPWEEVKEKIEAARGEVKVRNVTYKVSRGG